MYEIQLQWIRQLQDALRSSWMDGFFKAWNQIDTSYFSILVITLIWYLWDRRIGIRFFYLLVLSLILNKFLKVLFHLPRPCQIDSLVGILCSNSPGFPSGGAQSAALYFGIVYLECKKNLYRWLAFLFAFLLCFSRVYLGVHFPTDILGGLVVGGLLLLAYLKLFPLFEKFWKIPALVFPLVLLLGLLIPGKTFWVWYIVFSSLGVAVGLLTDPTDHAQMEKNFGVRCYQVCSVLVGLGLLLVAKYFLPKLEFLWNFAEGYWLSFLGGWIVLKIRRH